MWDMYKSGEFLDRTVIACFWSLLAGLQKSDSVPSMLLGLIGGRSGSVDIANFVGVRAISWDTNIFNSELAKVVPPGMTSQNLTLKLRAQGPFVIRLLNQKPMSLIAFLDYRHPEAPLTVPRSEAGAYGDVLQMLETPLQGEQQVYPLEVAVDFNMVCPIITLKTWSPKLIRQQKTLQDSLNMLKSPSLGIELAYMAEYEQAMAHWAAAEMAAAEKAAAEKAAAQKAAAEKKAAKQSGKK